MSNNVAYLDEYKAHAAGEVKCFGCSHEWLAVSPLGVVEYECPNCGSMKGRGKYECIRKEELHLHCDCGNNLFSVTKNGIYCPNCGIWQNQD